MAALNEITQVRRRLTQSASRVAAAYSAGADRPLGGYIALMAAYSSAVCALTGAAVLSGRKVPADGLSPYEVALTAAATCKISRLITKDPITSPLRAPFTTYGGTAGPAELTEDVRGQGVREAIGEMISSPFSASVWVATGLTAGRVFLPRMTRLAVSMFAALAVTDLLQFTYERLEKADS
jgi:hypothetical protein